MREFIIYPVPSSSYKRIAAGITLFFSVLFAPWWLSAALAIAFTFMFDWYYEALAAGFLTDALYGSGVPALYGMKFIFTAGAAVVVAFSMFARTQVRYYQ